MIFITPWIFPTNWTMNIWKYGKLVPRYSLRIPKKVILENLEDSFYRKFEKACERFKKRKNTNACNLSSSFKTVDKRRLEKKLKTAVESDEKREMTKETKWNGGGSESGKKLEKEGERGRELNLSDKQENPRWKRSLWERLEMIQLRESRNFRSNDIASR